MNKCYYVVIGLIFCAATPVMAQFNLNSISGHVGYRHEYEDQTFDGVTSSQLIRTPDVDLLLDGDIFSPALTKFYLESDLTNPISTNRAGLNTLNLNNVVWNYYRLDLRFLDDSPVRLEVRSMDGINEYHAQTSDGPEIASENRRQNQEVTLAVAKSDLLPPLSLDYSRTLSWAVAGPPSDVLNQSYSVSAASGSGTTSYNLLANLNENQDLLANTTQRIYDVRANAVKTLSETEHVDLQTDYSRFQGLGIFTGDASYFDAAGDNVRVNSTLSTSQTASPSELATTYTGTNVLDYFANSAMHYSFSASGSLTRVGYETDSRQTLETSNQMTLGSSAQHSDEFGAGRMTNSLGLTLGLQNNIVGFRTLGTSFANSYSSAVAGFDYGLSQGFSSMFSTRTGGGEYVKSSNIENVYLGGVLLQRWRERTTLSYNDTHASGAFNVPISYRSVQLSQTLTTPVHLYLRFTLDGGVSVNWYLAGVLGTTHSWDLGFTTGSFFVDGLSFRYLYTENYDLYYRFDTHDQTGTFGYQWRTIRFDLRLEEAQYITQRRDITFSAVRVF